MSVPEVVVFAEAEVPEALRVQVLDLQAAAFGDREPADRGPVHDPDLHPVSMLLIDGGTVVSALDVLGTHMAHAGQVWSVAGLSTVVTAKGRRRQGHGRTLVTAARAAIARSGADLALFTSDPPLSLFYRSCGFEVLEGAVVVGGTAADPLRSDSLDKVTLVTFFSDRARAQAPAFAHTDLGLYPGAVDRLW